MSAENVSPQIEIIVTGFGGQGIILAGKILGMAASLGDKKESTLVQAYGPESRGGACNAQVIISSRPIHYPYVQNPKIMIAMSQAGYDKFVGQLDKESVLLIDQDLVPETDPPCPCYAIPSTRMAEKLGHKMMANIIMLGFTAAITEIVTTASAKDTITRLVPKGTEEKNVAAFTKGFDYGLSALKGESKKEEGHTGVTA